MSLTKPAAKRPVRKPASKAGSARLSNAQLLKLAAKNKPPQAWYDEQANPTKPATAGERSSTGNRRER